LHRLLGGPALAHLRQRLRRAFEQAGAGSEPALLRLSGLAPHEAEALQALTGRPPRPSASMQVDLAALSARVQAAGLAESLRAALEQLDGPITARAAERAAALLAWTALARQAPHPALLLLLAEPRGLGLLRRLAAGDAAAGFALCERAARVLAALPAHGQPRAQLAALCLGNAHALDDGQPVATLVLAALRLAATEEGGESGEGTRALWAAQGVSVNELARPALSLNLPLRGGAEGTDGTGPGEPRYWSLRQLLRRPPPWQVAGRDVFVCENPNLMAMVADALGARSAPLLCTDGMPAAAQRALLAQVAAAGARLHYHGDFDWPGVAIGNLVQREFRARAWRFSAADYAAAVQGADAAAKAPLHGRRVEALWDAALAPAMQQAHCAVAEEALLQSLLPDLAA
jgi:uncharacterized protein (TIGR02679 family)